MPRFCFKIFALTFLFTLFFVIAGYADEKETLHFDIQYSTSGVDAATEVYIDNVATIVEEIWNFFKGKGYKNPLHVPDNPQGKEEKLQIVVTNRPIGNYGETTVIGKDGDSAKIPVITIDNNYSESGWNPPRWEQSGLDSLRVTLIHEIFHAVQQSYANLNAWWMSDLPWFWEGTAQWVEDEGAVLLGRNTDTLNSYLDVAHQIFDHPELSLCDRNESNQSYGVSLFFKYFSEHGGDVQDVLTKFDQNATASNSEDMLEAIRASLGGAEKLRNLYNDFAIACFVLTGARGFQDDGARSLSQFPLKIQQTFPAGGNAHYQAALPTLKPTSTS